MVPTPQEVSMDFASSTNTEDGKGRNEKTLPGVEPLTSSFAAGYSSASCSPRSQMLALSKEANLVCE